LEAEEFKPGAGSWKRQSYGENYYVGTFANTFLSRKAFLGAPEQCEKSVATATLTVPVAGRYLALIRYEAAYRFETRFRLLIEQNGTQKLDRLYGARDQLKIWPFGKRLTNEVAWDWGASENIVWQGHDALVDLEAGPTVLSLVAEQQPEPGARRNIDLVMLTSDLTNVQVRISKEGYLPLDGLLTQAGDLFLKVQNHGAARLALSVPAATEHSPYWVHQRAWKPKVVTVEAGQTTDWTEVGSLLDSLNDGQWQLNAKSTNAPFFDLEFATQGPSGDFQTIRRLVKLTNDVSLAYDADTRYSRRIRLSDEVLFELVDFLRHHPVHGVTPRQTLIYGSTFPARPRDSNYTASLGEFLSLMGATALSTGSRDDSPLNGLTRGYIDVRDQSPKQIEATCQKLVAEGKAERIACVSLGDEIGLASPPKNSDQPFREWLQEKGLKPSDVDPAAQDWAGVHFSLRDSLKTANPRLFYYSNLYRNYYGIQAQKELSEVLARMLPNALIGANYSPHHQHFYLGETHKWVTLFREGGMTMPWSEDYIFQVPVASQQMNFLGVDLFRAGIRNNSRAKIHFYVMPHWPGNTVDSWRRQFYGDLAHGAKIINLFEFRPVQVAYTENHCSFPEMFQSIRQAFHELGTFEDIIQSGQVRTGLAGLWFSETGDLWDDNKMPFDAAKRSLYLAIRHQQLPLDVVVDSDDLRPYRILYLTDQHVSRAGAKQVADWVRRGGHLFATAGAGMWDEFNEPNTLFRELIGVEPRDWRQGREPIRLEKQDLPFATPIETITLRNSKIPVFGSFQPFQPKATDGVEGRFSDGSPAVIRRNVGSGRVVYCAFLPAFSWLKPALPRRPVDRSSRDDSLCHFIPIDFDAAVNELIGSLADFERPVASSVPGVETTIIDSKSGMLIPLINWSGKPIERLELVLNTTGEARQPILASANAVQISKRDGKLILELPLSVADALIFRK